MSKELSSVLATRSRQRRQQIDAEAHIAGLDDDRRLGGVLDLGLSAAVRPGGADDVHLAGLWRRARRDLIVAAGTVKSMMPSALSSNGPHRPVSLMSVLGHARQRAGVPADQRRARVFQRTRQRKILAVGDRLDQRAAHPPAGAGDQEPHFGHGSNSITSGRGYSPEAGKGDWSISVKAAGRRSPR